MVKLIAIWKSNEMTEFQGVPFDDVKKLSAAGHVLDPIAEGTPAGFRIFFKRTDLRLLVDEQRQPLVYKDKHIYRYPDGKLINTDGIDVVTIEYQNADPDEAIEGQIYITESGKLVDGSGSPIKAASSPIATKIDIKLEPVKCVMIASNSHEVRMIKSPATLLTTMKTLGLEEGRADLNDWDMSNTYDPIKSASSGRKRQTTAHS